MSIIEAVLSIVGDSTTVQLSCGHTVILDTRNGQAIKPGNACGCTECGIPKPAQRALDLLHSDKVLDALVDDYVTTMQAQGHAIATVDKVAIRRAANIQYAWYCAMRRVLP